MIQEIIDSLKGRRVLSCVAPSIQDSYDFHKSLDSIAGVDQGGRNAANVGELKLLDDKWEERDYRNGKTYYGDLYLVMWDLNGRLGDACLVVFEK